MDTKSAGMTYEEIKSKCQLARRLYEDPDFPANNESLNPTGSVPEDWSWKRPKELHKNAKFVVDGASRFDLAQGDLGDCWFIAAAATLATRKDLFHRVVPPDQSFYKEYSGIFRFNFWRFGIWQEVVVDDRLPVDGAGKLVYCHNRETPNEYWGSLLEKAYAKLNGSYIAVRAGTPCDALVDFTGGISESFYLKKEEKIPPDFFDIVVNSYRMGSLLGAGISGRGREEKMWNGLFKGHAYSITNIIEARILGWQQKLIRLRNPWGQKEWTGAWGDESDEWKSIPECQKKQLGLRNEDDGEFWMSFDDFLAQFHLLDIVHLGPQAFAFSGQSIPNIKWEEAAFHGEWIKGVSAGGCGLFSAEYDLYYTNPQYQFHLSKSDDNDVDNQCTCVISLMLKDFRKRKLDRSMRRLLIGIDVHQIKDPSVQRLDGVTNVDKSVLKKQFHDRTVKRELTCRLQLHPGVYCVIPNTLKSHQNGDFLLRIFTYTKISAKVLEEDTKRNIDDKPEVPRSLAPAPVDVYSQYANTDGFVDASDLRQLLNHMFKREFGEMTTFSVDCTRSLMAMRDNECLGVLDYDDFLKLWDELVFWRKIFIRYDKDKTGSVELHELRRLLGDLGYKLSPRSLRALAVRYGGNQQTLSFEDYVTCITKTITMYSAFKNFSNEPEGNEERKASIGLDDWLWTTMYY